MYYGEVISWGAGRFQWTIDNFLLHVRRQNTSIKSPRFRFSGFACGMLLKFSEASSFLNLTFFLRHAMFIEDPPSINVTLGMRTGYRGKIEYRSGEPVDGKFEIDAWMTCSEFLERRCEILNDGCLIVFCKLTRLDTEESASVLQEKLPSEENIKTENEASASDSDEEETDSEWKDLKTLQKDLKNLLISGEDCDVTIKVQGKEFCAHRNFLRARSPVFKSMFSHEMVEKQSGVVVIDDCDPAIFPDLLNYVYTGSTKHISHENVFGLYTVSDKYGVQELKKKCAEFMKSNMSVDTFCDTVTLAVLHTENELISVATEFFCSNATEITKTAKWQTFLHENTTVGNELIIILLSKKKLNRHFC